MENQQKPQVKIKASDEALKGSYSNLVNIAHNREEFILDFISFVPPQGSLNSRVFLSPGHLKRLWKVLGENVKQYEGKFGEITEASVQPDSISFNPPQQ